MLGKEEKKGQVTIFIIVAIVIVAVGVLAYFVYPRVQTTVSFDSENPNNFIQTCLEKEIEKNVELISANGGSLNPQNFFLYQDSKVEYLCYTNEDYKTCVMQQPLLKEHIEKEIKNSVEVQAKECFEELKKNYEDRGETAVLQEGNAEVKLIPEKITLTFNHILTVTKEDSQRYESFVISLDNNLYELVSIAESILEWETLYGDADTSSYMDYYHNLKAEKKKQVDGTKIYILTNIDNENKFQFASRSVAWPSGYGETIV